MRPLKFRIWDKADREWTSYAPFFSSAHGKIFEFFPSKYQAVNLVIQQFTGLKDIEGKEIYENDIIQLEGSPITYSIEWDRYQWAINAHGALGYDPDWNIQPFNHCVYERAIVVGNIFENSDLLES